jgi:uncharacterized membrane protein YfcA
MDPEQSIANGMGVHQISAPPPLVYQVISDRRTCLRPLWVGILLTIGGFFLFAFDAPLTDAETVRGLEFLCSLPALVFYFMVVHRIIRVLDEQPGWSVKYTPAAAVWKHFIPLYGIYFLSVWPRDVESYINWRLGRESRVGLWTFAGLLIGFLLRFADMFLGMLVIMASLYILYAPLKRAVAATSPTDTPAPGYSGTLGLR